MKKCKECGREETGYGSLLDEDGYCFTCGVKYSKEKIKRLQEQLKEANVVVKWYDGLEKMLIGWEICTGQKKGTAEKYLEKWGVK